MKKEHPNAQVLRWIADGEQVEVKVSETAEWMSMRGLNDQALASVIDPPTRDEFKYRIKPKTIPVGDREIEAPVMSGPGYFITDIGTALQWFGDHRDTNSYFDMQKNGRVFASIEAARAAQEAITALLTKEPS